MDVLSESERKELDDLPMGYNVVKENGTALMRAAARVEISRRFSVWLLKASFWLNAAALAIFAMSAVLVVTKPQPSFYAATPSGKLIGPLPRLTPH